jgi:hypothetical protein
MKSATSCSRPATFLYPQMLRFKPAWLALAMLAAGTTHSALHAHENTASYQADFEAPGFTPGSIHGQRGWSVDQGKAEIVSGAGVEGSAGLVLHPADPFSQARLSLKVDIGNGPLPFVDLKIRPVAGLVDRKDEMLDIDSARVGLFREPDAEEAACWVFDGDGNGGGIWVETPLRLAVDSVTGQVLSWHRLTVQMREAEQVWDLWIDGTLAASGIGFQVGKAAGAPVCILMGDHSAPVALDDLGLWASDALADPVTPDKSARTATVDASANVPLDTDSDGLPDVWERKYGLNPKDGSDSNADPDKDGLVNRDEFALKLDPRKTDLIADHLPPPRTDVFSQIQFPTIRRGKAVDFKKPFEIRN